jgi:hypothetical protein
MSPLSHKLDGFGVPGRLAGVASPTRSSVRTRGALRASRAFDIALGTGDPDGPSGRRASTQLAGVEHEFAVLERGEQLDFRSLVLDLGIRGPRLDPADPFAHRLLSGSVITADDREAEIAIPPVALRPGFSDEADGRAADVRDELLRLIGPERSLAGYSTHLSISMRDGHLDAAARLYARTFAPALMLLLDHRDAPGLLVRPRPGRLELGGAYLAGDPLRAALVFAASSARAVSAALAGGRAGFVPGRRRYLPPVLATAPEPANIRYGWFVAGTAFGSNLYAHGRSTVLPLSDGRTMTAGDHLRRAWDAARPRIEAAASPAELALLDDVVEGRLPLPSELPRDRPDGRGVGSVLARINADPRTHSEGDAGDHGRAGSTGAIDDRPGARPPANPYGVITQPRERPAYSVRPLVLRWDFSLLELEARGSTPARAYPARAYAVVPGPALSAYVTRLDAGSLDHAIEAFLANDQAPSAQQLVPDQVVTPGLYDQPGSIGDLLPLERTPITGDFARTDKSKRRSKRLLNEPRTTPGPEPGPPPGATLAPVGRGGRLVPAAILLGCLAIAVVGAGLLVGRGGTPGQPTSIRSAAVTTASSSAVAPSSVATSATPTAEAPSPALGPVGLGWTGTTADVTFKDLTFVDCASATRASVPPTFGAGWTLATKPGAGLNVAVNMLALSSSSLAPPLNGSLTPSGVLHVTGDNAIENIDLSLTIPPVPGGSLLAPLAVAGSAQVAIHTGSADCDTGWTVSGTLTPHGASPISSAAPSLTPTPSPNAIAAAEFTLGLALNYGHSGATTSVCLSVSSEPAQAGAPITATIAGPGVVGSSQISGTLLADGTRHGHFTIDLYGNYAVTTSVTAHGVTRETTQMIDVTAAPGQGQCP